MCNLLTLSLENLGKDEEIFQTQVDIFCCHQHFTAFFCAGYFTKLLSVS